MRLCKTWCSLISKSASPAQFPVAQATVQTCVSDILSWMNSNKLKLNTDKTEVMHSICIALSLIGLNKILFKENIVMEYKADHQQAEAYGVTW